MSCDYPVIRQSNSITLYTIFLRPKGRQPVPRCPPACPPLSRPVPRCRLPVVASPEVVQFEENGVDASGMDYSKMTPLLVEAVNALRAEKDAEIARLQVEIYNMAKRLERMEATMKRLVEK